MRESTKKGRNQLRKILQNDKLGSMKIGRVTISDAKDWAVRMEEKGYAYQTIKNHKRSLKAIFYTAIDDGFIRANPFNWKMDDKIVKNNTKPKIALTDGQNLFQTLQCGCSPAEYWIEDFGALRSYSERR